VGAVKKYRVIAKVGNWPDGSAQCVKYRVNDLVRFAQFLDERWPTWRWFNVYAHEPGRPGAQLANFTNSNRPQRPHL
jgi:hypothetical protein